MKKMNGYISMEHSYMLFKWYFVLGEVTWSVEKTDINGSPASKFLRMVLKTPRFASGTFVDNALSFANIDTGETEWHQIQQRYHFVCKNIFDSFQELAISRDLIAASNVI